MTSTLVSTPVSPTIQVFTEEPSSSFTGLAPATITGFVRLESGALAAAFKLLNSITLKSESTSMEDVIGKSKSLACITYDRGVIKAICILSIWASIFEKKGVTEVVLSPGSSESFKIIREEIDIQQMNDESYKKMSGLCTPLIKV